MYQCVFLLVSAQSLFPKQNCSFLELHVRLSLEHYFLEKCCTKEAFSCVEFLLMSMNQFQCGAFFSSRTKSPTAQKQQVYCFSRSVKSIYQFRGHSVGGHLKTIERKSGRNRLDFFFFFWCQNFFQRVLSKGGLGSRFHFKMQDDSPWDLL